MATLEIANEWGNYPDMVIGKRKVRELKVFNCDYYSAIRLVGVSEGEEKMETIKQYGNLNRLTSISQRSPIGVMASYAYTYNRADQRVRAEREKKDPTGTMSTMPSAKSPSEANTTPQGRAISGQGFSYGYNTIGNPKQASKMVTPFDDTRDNNWDQRSGYQANILNQYQKRTVSPVAELLGQSDPRANLTARATDRKGNQLRARSVGVCPQKSNSLYRFRHVGLSLREVAKHLGVSTGSAISAQVK